jgi:regulator of protease activity HflC (stomatin/prohibitin superfamily)
MNRITKLAAFVFFLVTLNACTRIEPGNVGVRVDLVGKRGVAVEEVGVGRYLFNPLSTDFYEFPVYTQARVMTVNFNSSEGSSFSVPLAIEYNYVPGNVGGDHGLFSQYRQDSETIFNTVITRVVSDKFNKEGSTKRSDEILGERKSELLQEVTLAVQKEFEPQGIKVTRLSYGGEFIVPDTVKQAIDNVLKAKQATIAAQQEKAQAEAKAAANQALDSSLTPSLLKYKELEMWDGKYPLVTNGATPLINITPKASEN